MPAVRYIAPVSTVNKAIAPCYHLALGSCRWHWCRRWRLRLGFYCLERLTPLWFRHSGKLIKSQPPLRIAIVSRPMFPITNAQAIGGGRHFFGKSSERSFFTHPGFLSLIPGTFNPRIAKHLAKPMIVVSFDLSPPCSCPARKGVLSGVPPRNDPWLRTCGQLDFSSPTTRSDSWTRSRADPSGAIMMRPAKGASTACGHDAVPQVMFARYFIG